MLRRWSAIQIMSLVYARVNAFDIISAMGGLTAAEMDDFVMQAAIRRDVLMRRCVDAPTGWQEWESALRGPRA